MPFHSTLSERDAAHHLPIACTDLAKVVCNLANLEHFVQLLTCAAAATRVSWKWS